MTTVDVEFLESGPSDEEPSTPETAKKIAGKSPTRIALERLRKDPVAIVCGAITGFLVLAALLAPVITQNWPWGPISTEPNSPGTNLDPINGNLPFFGPPLHGFIWEHPLGIDPYVASDNLAQLLYGLRTDLFIGFAATVFSVLIDPGTLVLAVLQEDIFGVWVRTASPHAASNSIKIQLNKPTPVDATVGWFLVN